MLMSTDETAGLELTSLGLLLALRDGDCERGIGGRSGKKVLSGTYKLKATFSSFCKTIAFQESPTAVVHERQRSTTTCERASTERKRPVLFEASRQLLAEPDRTSLVRCF